jgi:hypothetical protein
MANTLTAYLYGQKAGERDPVTVFDVGCSGGVSDQWNGFGPALRAVGFDPLIAEIDRLQRAEKREGVRYEAAFVGLSAAQEAERATYERSLSERERFDPQFFGRSSAWHAAQLLSYSHQKEVFNSGREVVYTDRRVALDDLPQDFGSPDFVKVDTDGHDICVITGAQRQLESALGANIECFLSGSSGRYANTFAKIDRFMSSVGFSLFHIDPQRYTRASLPGTFCYDLLAQTQRGSVVWTDAIYFRDLANPDYDVFDFHPTGEQVIKLACLMESFGLSDCSAELLIARADQLPYPLDELLDKLVPKKGLSYRDFIKAFEEDPRSFFPSHRISIVDFPLVAGRSVINLREARNDPGWGSSIERASDSHLRVKPGTSPFGYAATLPLPSRSGVGAVELDVEVMEGAISLASANSDLTELGSQVFIEKSGRKVVILPLTEGTSEAVVIRGGTPSGAPSAILIYGAFLLNA